MNAVLLNRITVVLALVGTYIAGLLSLEKAMNLQLPCGASNDCALISNHPTGFWIGIPVAYFGLIGYLFILVTAMYRSINGIRDYKELITMGLIFSAIGTLASFYLQYTSLVVLKKFCPYCFASAVTMTSLLAAHLVLRKAVAAGGEERRSNFDLGLPWAGIVAVILALTIQSATVGKTVGGVASLSPDKAAKLIPALPHIYGDKSAKITIVEFADLCCPKCQTMGPQVKELVDKYPGKIRLIYRHFLIPSHQLAPAAAAMSEVAGEKGRFWEFATAIQKGMNGRTPEKIDEISGAITAAGMDPKEVAARLQNEKDPVYQRIQDDRAAADALGVNSTPTFFVMVEGRDTKIARADALFEVLGSDEYVQLLK